MLSCLPSFVFMAEADAVRAMDASNGSGVPGFSVMNIYGVLVRIKDKDLASLREVADLNPRRDNPIQMPKVGTSQRIISGAFQGIVGKVVGHTKRHCLVELGEKKMNVVKIPPFLLEDYEA